MQIMTSEYVQYGCGWYAPAGWLNFDASPTLRWERLPIVGQLWTKNTRRFPENVRYGDIVKGLSISKGSCKGIYCSHVLEHLALTDFEVALAHTWEYLAPGGAFRFVVPDLEHLARAYLLDEDSLAACRFMEATYLGKKQRVRGLRAVLLQWLGNSGHLWMWDEKSMFKKLSEHGFKNIRRAYFGDAEDKKFNEVEDKGRFEGCLAMQCERQAGPVLDSL